MLVDFLIVEAHTVTYFTLTSFGLCRIVVSHLLISQQNNLQVLKGGPMMKVGEILTASREEDNVGQKVSLATSHILLTPQKICGKGSLTCRVALSLQKGPILFKLPFQFLFCFKYDNFRRLKNIKIIPPSMFIIQNSVFYFAFICLFFLLVFLCFLSFL